ncbi:hypothetical protein MMC10_008984 [Thelotrema lepadinum]|nr:hypothetical protein [Thelotrema lepadinum]
MSGSQPVYTLCEAHVRNNIVAIHMFELPHVDRAGQLRQLDPDAKVGQVNADNDLNDTLDTLLNQTGADDDDLDCDKASVDDAVQASKAERQILLEQPDFVHL